MVIPVIRRLIPWELGELDHGSHGNPGALEIRAGETICEPAGAPLLRVSWALIIASSSGGETKITQSQKPGFGESHKKVWVIPCSNSFKIFIVFPWIVFFLTLALPPGNQLHGLLEISHLYRSMMISYGGFLNWGYPQIIQISTIFVLNPMVLGTLI